MNSSRPLVSEYDRAVADVLVVGAGVAGAATAIHLAERGRQVLLVDRSAFPRRKPCGEGLFPAGVRELRSLNLLDQLQSASVLERLRFHGYGHSAWAWLDAAGTPALGVRRDLLDAALLRRAAAAGVEVRLQARVSDLAAEGKDRFSVIVERRYLEPAAIVAADGLNSALRRQAGLDRPRRGKRYGVTAHIELRKAPDPAVDVFFRPGFEIYVTPVGGRVVNVAILMAKPLTKQLAGAPDHALETLLRREQCLPGPWRLMDAPLVAGPFPARARRLWNRNLVLAGDAAGFFDGITGEGMSTALVSARHCAEAVDGFLSTGSHGPFKVYEKARRRLARNPDLLGRVTLMLAGRPWLARRALRGLERRPGSFTRLVAISSGEAGLGSVPPWEVARLLLG